MRSIVRITVAALTLSVSCVSWAQDKPKPKPTGACTITVYGISPTCVSPISLDGCNAAAAKVKGVASWSEGKSCPRN